jgi:hypothetical protein
VILFGTREIKVHVERLPRRRAEDLRGRVVIDVPAGFGHSSCIQPSRVRFDAECGAATRGFAGPRRIASHRNARA